MTKFDRLSIFISLILRHKPEEIHIDMDVHGWVDTERLIEGILKYSKYDINLDILKQIVQEDDKGRYRFNEDFSKIKACQGHSIEWVIPELSYPRVPDVLYHGSTIQALEKIKACGYISKMKRHAVHMSDNFDLAEKSAKRWKHQVPVVLKIDARQMVLDGFQIGKTENDVWCIESVNVKYIIEEIYVV